MSTPLKYNIERFSSLKSDSVDFEELRKLAEEAAEDLAKRNPNDGGDYRSYIIDLVMKAVQDNDIAKYIKNEEMEQPDIMDIKAEEADINTQLFEEPDFHDPNNHYCACNRAFRKRGVVIAHVRTKHPTQYAVYKQQCIEEKPNAEDEDNYCSVCKQTYASKASFINHCKHIHRINLV